MTVIRIPLSVSRGGVQMVNLLTLRWLRISMVTTHSKCSFPITNPVLGVQHHSPGENTGDCRYEEVSPEYSPDYVGDCPKHYLSGCPQ
ncbi:MAG: hypothetical protein ACLR0U_12740 [Enterocloster clostridioformis]